MCLLRDTFFRPFGQGILGRIPRIWPASMVAIVVSPFAPTATRPNARHLVDYYEIDFCAFE